MLSSISLSVSVVGAEDDGAGAEDGAENGV
jgi:hypothetical protein